MNIIKKRRQISPLRLVFAECLTMVVISACVCGILYGCVEVSETGMSFLPLFQLFTGITAFAMVAWRDTFLSKISFPKYLIVLAFVYGILLFEFLLYWGLKSFLCLATAAIILFAITAIIGFYLGQIIRRRNIYTLCCIIACLGIVCEAICLFISSNLASYSIIISMSLCAGLLNMADFSRYNRIMYGLAHSNDSSNTDFVLALMFFINLMGGIAATDATRLASKFFLYREFKRLTY